MIVFFPNKSGGENPKTLPVGAAGFDNVGKSGRPKPGGWGAEKNRVLFVPSVQ